MCSCSSRARASARRYLATEGAYSGSSSQGATSRTLAWTTSARAAITRSLRAPCFSAAKLPGGYGSARPRGREVLTSSSLTWARRRSGWGGRGPNTPRAASFVASHGPGGRDHERRRAPLACERHGAPTGPPRTREGAMVVVRTEARAGKGVKPPKAADCADPPHLRAHALSSHQRLQGTKRLLEWLTDRRQSRVRAWRRLFRHGLGHVTLLLPANHVGGASVDDVDGGTIAIAVVGAQPTERVVVRSTFLRHAVLVTRRRWRMPLVVGGVKPAEIACVRHSLNRAGVMRACRPLGVELGLAGERGVATVEGGLTSPINVAAFGRQAHHLVDRRGSSWRAPVKLIHL